MGTRYRMLGLMSGTSLDGVDLAYCEFFFNDRWNYDLIHCETSSYDNKWKKKLENLAFGSAEEISEADCSYGVFLGKLAEEFCSRNNVSPDYICSHGHTIFHQPQKGFTKQIGSGAFIAAASGIPVICDFRIADVANGGQGAPLVPAGDNLLFPEADYCLNLGGIANISFKKDADIIAFDICACNIVLNYYASTLNLPYDDGGKIAATGNINFELVERLNEVSFYSKEKEKSLGREDIDRDIFPLIENFNLSVEDILATFCFHIAEQIGRVTDKGQGKKMLLSGGGAFNDFLTGKITERSKTQILVPEKKIIEYKEALIFAFLGVLKLRGEANSYKSVTGAVKNSSGGVIYTND